MAGSRLGRGPFAAYDDEQDYAPGIFMRQGRGETDRRNTNVSLLVVAGTS